MFLVRLIYASTVCDNLTQNDIEELLSISKKKQCFCWCDWFTTVQPRLFFTVPRRLTLSSKRDLPTYFERQATQESHTT
ncbi:hypothetical protein VDT1_1066 [Vibrio sp. 16]|nr:hypothetical protein VDT1_1066 [Vibrio sp. 16]